MHRPIRQFLFVLFLWPALAFSQTVSSDSSYWSLSLPELQSAVNYYQLEMDALGEEKRNLIRRGIEDAERLLKTQPDPKIIDQILIRLADLYYYQAKDDYLSQMEAFESQAQAVEEPQQDFGKALAVYQRILDEFPQSEYVDDAVYNKGYLYEETGEFEKANRIYLYLIDAYPQSRYVTEAYMRLGESHFNPPVNDLTTAIGYYQKVLEDRGSPRFEEALYKIGWSHYRLSEYPQAISYFTSLVEAGGYDSNAAKNDLVAEAVEYIAISFIDFGGPAKAVEYLSGVGNPAWGWDMLERLGDVYREQKEEYGLAVSSYEALLPLVPALRKPGIQKKIIDCYYSLNDQSNLFSSRQKMVAEYGPASEWWKTAQDEKTKLKAYRLAEESLRENINALTKTAEKTGSTETYDQAVQLAREYLNLFAEDPYAYLVRWNLALILDTKLARYKEALQEYLTISMVYHGETYSRFAREKGLAGIQDAAENAIVVADSLMETERRSGTSTQAVSSDGKSSTPLSSAESWLAMAYDNYIKLFPFDRQTASILINAGALYFSHGQFNDALKYFKTLVKHFPNSVEMQQAQFAVLESYFAKRDYNSSEILAKKIAADNPNSDLRQKAERRKAESIFLRAQTLADAGQTGAAADEYVRMALESPEADFADRALFNAGKAYDQARQYLSAIQAYERLCSSYPGSPLLADALNNTAFDYGETGDFAHAAERYERLAELVKTADSARNARFNAWVFWNKAQNWPSAIRAGERYIADYPGSPDAESIGFRAGEFYLLSGDTAGAIQTYAGFPNRFPNSRFGVSAFHKAAQLQEAKSGAVEADRFYWAAYQLHQTLAQRGVSASDMDAADALYRSTRNLHGRYDRIEFTDPSTVAQVENELKAVLQRLIDQYGRIITFRTNRVPESLYQIGRLYEQYATAWNKQALPPLDPNNRVVMEKAIHEKASRIYGQSQAAYGKAVDALKKIIQETVPGTGSDSLLADAQLWLARSEEKISETLYRIAEINSQSVYSLLTAQVPEELTEVARLDYQNQLLTQAVRPVLDVIVRAHRYNLRVADSLSIHNSWTQASQSKILAALRLMGQQYARLSFDALAGYARQTASFRRSAERGSEMIQDSVDVMMHCLDLAAAYAQESVNGYDQGIIRAAEYGLADSSTAAMQSEKKLYALMMADSIASQMRFALTDQQKADSRFQSTQDPRFEEQLGVFEDQVFFLSKGYQSVLEKALQNGAEKRTPENLRIGLKLAVIEPDRYLPQFGLSKTQMIINTDSTWWCAPSQQAASPSSAVGMEGWTHPATGASESQIIGVYRIRVDGLPGSRGCVLRNDFTIPGWPISARLEFPSGPGRVVLNQLDWHGDSKAPGMQYFLDRGDNQILLEQDGRMWAEGRLIIDYIPETAVSR